MESNKAPIELTDFFESLGGSVDRAADILRESSTDGGKKLARDIEDWLDTYRDKPEISQAAIVDQSRSPEQQDLRNLESEFESIIERLERISHHE